MMFEDEAGSRAERTRKSQRKASPAGQGHSKPDGDVRVRIDSRRTLAGTTSRVEAQTPRVATPTANSTAGFPSDLGNEFLRERLSATQRELAKIGDRLRRREGEVLKLRRALNRTAQELGPTIPDVQQLAAGAPPPHAAGLTLLPVPLHLSKPVVQQHGYLDVLDVEKHVFTSRKWKRRYVVADDRGVCTFRTRDDFVQNAFHMAKESIQYRQCEYFVPNVANSLDRLPEDDSLNDDDRRLMLHNAANEPNRLYFGLIARQPPGLPSSDPVNPTLLLRTESIQEHEDWVHFIARMFNAQLYKQSFPLLFGGTESSSDNGGSEVDAPSARRTPVELPPAVSAVAESSTRELPAELPASADGMEESSRDGSDNDTVRDHGEPTSDTEQIADRTPMPPRNPPPDDALTANKQPRPPLASVDSQTELSIAAHRGEQLHVLPRTETRAMGCQATFGDLQTKEASPMIPAIVSERVACATQTPPPSSAAGGSTARTVVSANTQTAPVPTSANDVGDGPMSVAALQAELLQLRGRLTTADAKEAAGVEALHQKQLLIDALERDLATAKSELASAEETVRCLNESSEMADSDIRQLQSQLDVLRRAASTSPAKARVQSVPGVKVTAGKAGVPEAHSLANGQRRRRQRVADNGRASGHTTESYSGSYETECSVCRSSESESSNLEDLDFRCPDCSEMYAELARVVDERDRLLRDIARRHHEYELGIADMCDRVIGDMDALHQHYQVQALPSEADAKPSTAMIRIDAVNGGAETTVAVGSNCEVLSAERVQEGSRRWSIRIGTTIASVQIDVINEGATYAHSVSRRANSATYVVRGPNVETFRHSPTGSRAVIPHAISP